MKNIVVVGGTKGIGESIVKSLSADNIFVYARNIPAASNCNVQYISTDVTQHNLDISILPETVDGLVYCPGSINLKPFHRLTEQDFYADWQINFLGAVKIIQQLLPLMKKAGLATIVLFSTVAVDTGMPFHASIASAKGAVEALTKSLAAELAPKITVNCIAPSLTQTSLADKLVNTPEKMDAGGKRHPLQRIGQPADIAELACFLLSGKASWMTGQILHVDGGMSSVKV